MSPRLSHLFVALLLGAASVHAEDPAPAKTEPAKTEPVPPYELKNRSKFEGPESNARAPFWPIGWVKRRAGVATAAAPVVAAQRVLIDEKSFKVTSILLGTGTTPSLAVINGRAYSEGEFLRMPKSAATPPVRIRVQRINDGNVILQNADQILVASLSRPELSNKRDSELLLDPDR